MIWSIIRSTVYDAIMLFIPNVWLCSKYSKWFIKVLCHQLKCLHTLRKKYKRSPTDYFATRMSQAEDLFQSKAAMAMNLILSLTLPVLLIQQFTVILEVLLNLLLSHLLLISILPLPAMIYLELIFSINTVFTEPSTLTDCPNLISSGEINTMVFSEVEINSALSQLDPNKATGIDMISPKI